MANVFADPGALLERTLTRVRENDARAEHDQLERELVRRLEDADLHVSVRAREIMVAMLREGRGTAASSPQSGSAKGRI